ncbi:MAG: tol-pal system protein YbgF [Pusillimonas sp.]
MKAHVPLLRRLALPALFAATLAAVAPAHAFADDEARRAILELREQMRNLTEQNRQARLLLADQLDTLRQEVTTMRGQVERMRFELDLKNGNTLGQNTATQVGNPQEQMAFNTPMAKFREGKYKEAADGFRTFLTQYPNSELSAEAGFYQGSSLYAAKDFKSTIPALQALLQNHADSERAPDALLVMAAAQIELNDLAGAKTSLQSIVNNYPQSKAARTAQDRLTLLQ